MTSNAAKLGAALHWLGIGNRGEFDGPAVVVSPHLDDAVLSVGAAIAHATRRGVAVTVLTVFGGDPSSSAPASAWDKRAGFRSAGEAVTARRAEDHAACAVVGARPVWLPLPESGYREDVDEEAIGRELAPSLDDAGTVFVPGFPLAHPDHELVTRLVLERIRPPDVFLYVEQPYALWTPAPSAPPSRRGEWQPLAADVRDRVAKIRACRAYRSQLPLFGARALAGITRYEAARGGEAVSRAFAAPPAAYPESPR